MIIPSIYENIKIRFHFCFCTLLIKYGVFCLWALIVLASVNSISLPSEGLQCWQIEYCFFHLSKGHTVSFFGTVGLEGHRTLWHMSHIRWRFLSRAFRQRLWRAKIYADKSQFLLHLLLMLWFVCLYDSFNGCMVQECGYNHQREELFDDKIVRMLTTS